jgi:Fe-S oxidoreductase
MNREKAYCCGGGGLIPSTNPLLKNKVANDLMAETTDIEFDKIYTPCASCRMVLSQFKPTIGLMDLLIEVVIEKR